ncbi:MAG: HAMP domain-containing histidine kinase, partial [Firmicutes bacterium]|nr:HAMP domain-containing histidine kinase [Bacillota bacterium]
MLRSVYSKFILGYILFGLIGFITVAIFSQRRTYDYLVRQNAEKLYDEAILMASTYEDNDYFFTDINDAPSRDISMVASFINARIWITDNAGRIVLDSAGSQLVGSEINGFDPASNPESYRIGYYYGMFPEEMLSVEAPINYNYAPIGYVLIHYPMSLVVSSTNEILNIVYLTAVVIFVLSLIILLVFTVYVYIPLREITFAAREYAAGHLDYKIKTLNHHDEVSYLGDTLNYMASELEDMEKYQRDFIANVSHDFRSPLTSIKGYLEAILDGTIPQELHEKYILRVISETERLRKLTEGMISLGSMEVSTMLKRTNFDINSTIRDICASNENACRKKNIHFELIFEDESEMVYADHAKIQQVLYNLIDNAIKFSHQNGIIYITTGIRQRKVFVSVKDTGIGIPRQSIKKIWDRFYKSDLSRGKDKTGTGLGLSIVKEIIQAHNETIDVVSTEGAGAEFTFTL